LFIRVLPAERSEPSLKVDEYHLIKEGDSSAVKLSELTRTLSKQPKHSQIAHDLKVAQRRTKTLPKPLEKPEANRVSCIPYFMATKLGNHLAITYVTYHHYTGFQDSCL